MANNFKSDDSFLRKLVVGAGGTNVTISQLRTMGFNPIELERGSTGFKIWRKIKIKRVRVPDIMCLNTGLRFESRGKTKLEISMSHSRSDPDRAWDAGLRDDDYVSIVTFQQSDDSPINIKQTSPAHFIRVVDMRRAFHAGQITVTQPKGVEEGSEIRVIWTCSGANERSVVTGIESGRIYLDFVSEAGKQKVILSRSHGHINLLPLVNVGQIVEANQIVASVVPVAVWLHCPAHVNETYFLDKLLSVNLSERYAAAKALRYRGSATAKTALESRMNDPDEGIYVQLEAAAALAAHDEPRGWQFIEGKLRSPILTVPLETQLETVIVVSEIPSDRSQELLIEVLQDSQRDDELRAGAAWALGQFATARSASALVDTFNLSPAEIKVEAARALLRIAEPQVVHLIELLQKADPAKRDGLSWVLARTGRFDPSDIVVEADENLRKWMSYIIGYGKDRFANSDIEAICRADPEVYFAASVLWQVLASWINNLKEY